MSQPYKLCPQCGQPAALQTMVCQQCGRHYRTQFVTPDQTQVVMPPPPVYPQYSPFPTQPPANVTSIAAMWVLTFLCFIAYQIKTPESYSIMILLDIPAVMLAITLAMSRNSTDKTNGWVKLILELMGFFFGFFTEASRF